MNKGLEVKECSVKFSQKIRVVRGFKGFKANVVELKKPVSKVEFIYSGRLGDYRDVLQYLKDSIIRDYTLLRTDSLFYPIPAEPTFEDLVKSVVSSEFEARITVEGVPDDLKVAFGGEIRGNQPQISGVNRLDIAVAPFKVIEETPFRLFILSRKRTERTLELARRAYDFYSSLLGKREDTYTIIETPEDYGGQAGKGYMLISGSALRVEVPAGVYHELAHLWNPRAEPEAHLSRFFDEAFANYLTALAIKELQGLNATLSLVGNVVSLVTFPIAGALAYRFGVKAMLLDAMLLAVGAACMLPYLGIEITSVQAKEERTTCLTPSFTRRLILGVLASLLLFNFALGSFRIFVFARLKKCATAEFLYGIMESLTTLGGLIGVGIIVYLAHRKEAGAVKPLLLGMVFQSIACPRRLFRSLLLNLGHLHRRLWWGASQCLRR